MSPFLFFHFECVIAPTLCIYSKLSTDCCWSFFLLIFCLTILPVFMYTLILLVVILTACVYTPLMPVFIRPVCFCTPLLPVVILTVCLYTPLLPVVILTAYLSIPAVFIHLFCQLLSLLPVVYYFLQTVILSSFHLLDFDNSHLAIGIYFSLFYSYYGTFV